jgi:hypothetical protein
VGTSLKSGDIWGLGLVRNGHTLGSKTLVIPTAGLRSRDSPEYNEAKSVVGVILSA